MALRYMGFEQRQNTRVFSFQNTVDGLPPASFIVEVDLRLFSLHHLGIQEGPRLCENKICSNLRARCEHKIVLTSEDIRAYSDALVADEIRTAQIMKSRSRRARQDRTT